MTKVLLFVLCCSVSVMLAHGAPMDSPANTLQTFVPASSVVSPVVVLEHPAPKDDTDDLERAETAHYGYGGGFGGHGFGGGGFGFRQFGGFGGHGGGFGGFGGHGGGFGGFGGGHGFGGFGGGGGGFIVGGGFIKGGGFYGKK